MSFVKKAAKKVFGFVKRLVKNKIFQVVAVIALTVFTAGVAAGGFAAFSGVNTIGGFFTAVGQTMATGAASIANVLGMKGTSAYFASKGGAAALEAGLVSNAGTALAVADSAAAAGNTALAEQAITAEVATTGATKVAAGSTIAQTTGQAASTSGFWNATKAVLGKKVLGDVTVGQMATSFAVSGASQMYAASQVPSGSGYVAGGTALGKYGGKGSAGTVDKITYSRGRKEAEGDDAAPQASTLAAVDTQGTRQGQEAGMLGGADQETQAGLLARNAFAQETGQPVDITRGLPGPSAKNPEGLSAERAALYNNGPVGGDFNAQQGLVQQDGSMASPAATNIMRKVNRTSYGLV